MSEFTFQTSFVANLWHQLNVQVQVQIEEDSSLDSGDIFGNIPNLSTMAIAHMDSVKRHTISGH